METATQSQAESGVESDDLNVTTITVVGLISAALVLASALGVKALFQAVVDISKEEKVYGVTATQADTVIDQQNQSLMMSPREMPGQQGVYSLPIDDAMELVVKELSAEQAE